jgi:hypothetical protein
MTGPDVVGAGGMQSVGEAERRAWGGSGVATRVDMDTLRNQGDLGAARGRTVPLRPACRRRGTGVLR